MVHPIWNAYPEIEKQLQRVREIMLNELTPTHQDVRQTIEQYINASGKFIRAGICLLFAQYSGQVNEQVLYRAASIEILHLATLIHDDVIDNADTRRSLLTMHQQYSNRIAIYAGDYLLAYSARLAKKGFDENIPRHVVNDRLLELVLSGELRQLMNQYNTELTLNMYLKQIRGKTAQLFGLSAQAGVLSVNSTAQTLNDAYQAGIALGMSFQLTDDLIDYEWESIQSGKPQYQDVQNGIYTAPVLFAKMRHKQVAELLSQNHWQRESLAQLHHLLEETQAIVETRRLSERYMARCYKRMKKLFTLEQCHHFSHLVSAVFR